MSARIAAARQTVPTWALVLAGVLSALLGVALAHEPAPGAPTTQLGGRAGATASTPGDLATLSPAARASISAALGADYPAYHFTPLGSGFQATNKAQQFLVTAGGAGVSMRARRLALDLRLQAIGYGSSLHAVDRPAPRVAANRVSYTHGDGVSEWYANGPLGLEQGFTIARPPAGGATGPLTLAIALAGNARASLAPGGQSVEFTAPGGGSVSYTGLAVTDAGGRALHGTLALAPGRLLLRVQARHARFPLRIDPSVTEVHEPEVTEQTLIPKEDERQHAGLSVALSADGNTALVGGPHGPGVGGAVWVFEREPNAQFQQTAELTVPSTGEGAPECAEHLGGDEVEGCSFGSAVALSANGATALVGDPHESVEGPGPHGNETFVHAGAVYVFTRSERKTRREWSEGVELESPKPSTHAGFGYSVALSEDGETALVGAPAEGVGGGRAWVFTGSGTSWQARDELKGTPGENKARFGRSVALSGDGDVAVVGAPNEEEKGAAWVFEGSPAAGFPLSERLVGSEQQAGSWFGYSVAVSSEGDTALVGAPRFDASEEEKHTGAAWAFAREGSAWTQMGAKLTGPGEPTESFGAGVALSADGQMALVGAPRALEGHGDAWFYEHISAASGAAGQQLLASDEQDTALFGDSVASSADAHTLLLGAPDEDRHEGRGLIVGRGPAVTHLSPAAGSPYGGTVVKIEGQHFTGVTAVKFGDAPAESFEETSEKAIKAVAPPGAGTVDVTVQTPMGTSEGPNHEGEDEFTYEPPAIYSVKPDMGPPAGGTEVTIRGDYFRAATAVYFGSTAATSMKVESEEVIKAVSPPEGVGKVYITVKAPFGESAATTAAVFVYAKGTESAGKRNEGEPPGNPPGNPPSGKEEPSGSGAPSTGVLAAGPLGAATCRASLLASRVFVQNSRLAVLKLVGKGAGSCRGNLRLRVRVKRKGHRSTLQTIGTAVFAIAGGKRVTVKVALTHAGRALLAAGHGRLNANLLIVRSSPAPALAQTATVHLAPQPKQRKPRHNT